MHGANYRLGHGQVFTRKEYIKGKPQIKIAKFQGGKRGTYQYCVQLSLNEKLQIRHMAIESMRLAANKTLEKTTGETGYYSRLRIYPMIFSFLQKFYLHLQLLFVYFLLEDYVGKF